MVLALAGDSTMTRLSAMTCENARVLKQKTADEPRTYSNRHACPGSVWRMQRLFSDQSAESLHRQLVSRLAGEHHQHHPLELLGVGLIGIERQHALDHDLALLPSEHVRTLE